ncbi:MAG: phosphatidylserine decarboxylase [Terriglobales bacterium]|jgi:phosphatidylserine decarboxylase
MVRDGWYYGFGFGLVAAMAGWLAGWPWAIVPLLLAAFFLWFFRDPERKIPQEVGIIVSPADGKVTAAGDVEIDGIPRKRISIFLSVFDVHVNRSPVEGVIEAIEYQRGKFLNAMDAVSADQNEQNVVILRTGEQTVVLKQIAGLLARRIVFHRSVGDRVERGERVGLIKFGSRTDLLLPPEATIQVKIGEHVSGGSSVLARLSLVAPSGRRI